MTTSKPKRNYKDSMFRQYSETPGYLASFHERITGFPTTPKDIIITIKNIMFNSQKNDISFHDYNFFVHNTNSLKSSGLDLKEVIQ